MTPDRAAETLLEVNARLASLERERTALLTVRQGLELLLGLIDSPAPSLTPVDGDSRVAPQPEVVPPVEPPTNAPGEGEDLLRGPVGPLPATEQPEPAANRAVRHGQRRASRSGSPAPAYPQVRCPQCDRIFKNANGLSIHVGKSHLPPTNGASVANVDEALLERARAIGSPVDRIDPLRPGESLGVEKDPREIHENCPDCGQLFTWEPAFITHKRTCRGRPE